MGERGDIMLISFTIRNVLSYKEEATLSMEATPIRAHPFSLLEAGKNKLLPIAAIYGANASGKTNLIKSLISCLSLVSGKPLRETRMFPFMLCDIEGPCRVSIEATVDGLKFKYELKIIGNRPLSESFYAVEIEKNEYIRIFERNLSDKTWIVKTTKNRIIDNTDVRKIRYVNEMEQGENPQLLVTALGRREDIPAIAKFYKWATKASDFEDYTRNYGFPIFSEDNDVIKYLENDAKKTKFLTFMQKTNSAISGILVSDSDNERAKNAKAGSKRVSFEYKTDINPEKLDDSNMIISYNESRGVHRALILYPFIAEVLENGGIFIADELETSLHPLLMVDLINMFSSRETNKGHGQLIFTTHNPIVMDKKYLRADEIWFVERNESGESSLYSLADFDIRSESDFCKNYIAGKFGAIPSLDQEGCHG